MKKEPPKKKLSPGQMSALRRKIGRITAKKNQAVIALTAKRWGSTWGVSTF